MAPPVQDNSLGVLELEKLLLEKTEALEDCLEKLHDVEIEAEELKGDND